MAAPILTEPVLVLFWTPSVYNLLFGCSHNQTVGSPALSLCVSEALDGSMNCYTGKASLPLGTQWTVMCLYGFVLLKSLGGVYLLV